MLCSTRFVLKDAAAVFFLNFICLFTF